MAVIKIYGQLAEWSQNNATAICSQIEKAPKNETIKIHIHSDGGNVTIGNMIYNAIKKSPNQVDVYIDGMAASMAAMLALAADNIYMAENALMMIHAPSTHSAGTLVEHAKTVKTLTGIETQFKKMLAARTGKTIEEVAVWMVGENWFSAQDAKEAGLIDGITDPIAEGLDVETENSTVEAVYARFTAHFEAHDTKETPINNTNNNQTQNKMNKEVIIKRYGLTSVTAQSSEDDIYAAIDAKFKAESDAKDLAQKELADSKQEQISAMLEPFKAKLTADEQKHYKAIGEKMGIDALGVMLKPLGTKTTITGAIASAHAGTTPQGCKTWDDYQKNDPRALERMRTESPDQFNALYKAEYGTDAPKY